MLPIETFKTVVAATPLISIDLLVRDSAGQVLLGKRTNRPAKGFWFVPGGRVLKDESLDCAFKRLLEVELAVVDPVSSKFLGVYQHFYDDNFSGDHFSTHYLVLAYEVQLQFELGSLPDGQHSDYCLMTEVELLSSTLVHQHSKWYFQTSKQADHMFASTNHAKS